MQKMILIYFIIVFSLSSGHHTMYDLLLQCMFSVVIPSL